MSFNIDEFFESIDVIVKQRLSDLSYDKTIIATIIDDSDKARGHYVVTDGTTRFDAYANDINYKTDDQVRVTIVNGDWSQKKFIAGLYDENKANSAVSYMPPLGNVFQTDYSKNQIGTNTSFTLYTNKEPYYQPIWSKQITKDSTEYTLQANGVYNVITLSGDFQTELGELSAGGYGLMLELYIQPEVDSEERIVKFVTLDSKEMIGNPYTFVIDSRQEKQIIIAEAGLITEIILYIYQGIEYDDQGDTIANEFKNKDGVNIGNLPIHFRNISVGFGSNLTSIEDNSLKIYTLDSTIYKYNISGLDSVNDKRMGLVWYNKTDDDKYIGFSDGIYDEDYDEIVYLAESYADERLAKNADKKTIANDQTTLMLAADIQESEPLMIAAYEALTTKLSQELQALGRQIPGTEFLDNLTPFISAWQDGNGDTQRAKLVAARDIAETAVQNLVALCGDIFQYAYNIQNGIEDEWETTWVNNHYVNTYSSAIITVLNEVIVFFNDMDAKTQTGQVLSGYRGIYSNYRLRVDREIAAIRLSMSQVLFTEADEDTLFTYVDKSKSDFPSYIKKEFPEYANRYCIYWYRYNEGYNLEYVDGGDNKEYQFGQFLGPNWERVTVDKNQNPIQNFGLPGEGEIIDGVQYNLASSPSEILLTRTMVNTTEIEKYQVVLFYNHTMIKSNTLIFTNTEADQIPLEFKADAADVLRIEHDTYSQSHYQSYTEANDLVNIADESRIRQLKCFYDGVFVGDEAMAGAELYWYIPINSTMLTYDKKYLTDRGFSTDDSWDENGVQIGKTSLSKTGYVYFSKTVGYTTTKVDSTDSAGNILYDAQGNKIQEDQIDITNADRYFFYKIKPYYEASAQNNTILVEAHITNGDNSKITVGEIPFTFSSFGTNGTKYTLVVVPNDTQIATLPEQDGDSTNPQFNLRLSLRDGSDNVLTMTTQKIVINEGTEDETEEFDIGAYGLEVEWYANNKVIPIPVITDIEDSNEKLVTIENVQDATNKYVGILNAKVSYDEVLSDGNRRKITLDTLYPVPYASSIDLYMAGPTTIVYNNQGIVSRLSDEPFKLFKHDSDGDVEVDADWSIAYYYDDGSLVPDNEDKEKIMAYMPKLNADNTLIPAPIYTTFEGERKFIVPVIVAKNGSSILWSQPIIITQNNYASSTLNDWNGEFEINEANGTILSTMVGAGRKNENNTFSGVLMGDIKKGANFDEDNASGLGLYGLHEGAQSFHFGIDGTAFLGKAGRGRIHFDGNNGSIESASYEEVRRSEDYTATAGMKIDLDDGFIDMHGTTKVEEKYNPSVNMLSEEEYNSLFEADEEITPTYEEYVTQFETDATQVHRKQSHIRIDVQSPYFTIHSANQINNNKHLMLISDREYYLQTDNYTKTDFPVGDNVEASNGAGFRIDLGGLDDDGNYKGGYIDAYNLKLTSKNLFINSVDSTKPYLIVKNDAGRNLMLVNDNSYYLQSADYETMSNSSLGKGMKLTFAPTGSTGIEAYNFDLRAGSANDEDHKIVLSDSGNPYFMINTVYNDEVKTLMQISDNGTETTFYMQSADFSDTSETGMRISVSSHEIEAYEGFKLKAYQTSGSSNYITIDANATAYPLDISSNFKVSWAGALTATGATVTGTINATGGTFTNEVEIKGSLRGGAIYGASIYAQTLDIGGYTEGTPGSGAFSVDASGNLTISDSDTFYVSSSGALTCTSANIGGWQVSGSDGGFSNLAGTLTMTPGGGLDFNGVFTVDENGNTIIDNLIVAQSLTVKGSRTGSEVFKVNNSGDLAINGRLYAETIGSATNLYFGSVTGGYGEGVLINGGVLGVYTDSIFLGNGTESTTVHAKGNLLYTSNIYCGQMDDAHKGKDVEFTVASGGLFGGKKQTLRFEKGILVSTSGTSGADDDGTNTIPSLTGNSGKFLSNNGSSLLWKSIGVSVAAKTNTTVTETATTGIYNVSIPYSDSYDKDVTVNTTQWVGFDVGTSTGGQITLYERSKSEAQKFKYYGVVYSSGTGNASGTVSGNVSGTIEAKVTST